MANEKITKMSEMLNGRCMQVPESPQEAKEDLAPLPDAVFRQVTITVYEDGQIKGEGANTFELVGIMQVFLKRLGVL